jgi:hypothetical protein
LCPRILINTDTKTFSRILIKKAALTATTQV